MPKQNKTFARDIFITKSKTRAVAAASDFLSELVDRSGHVVLSIDLDWFKDAVGWRVELRVPIREAPSDV